MGPRAFIERSRGSSNENGFSTIEAMVAIAILGIALIPLYGFQNTIVTGTARVEANLEAQGLKRLAQTYINGLVPAQLSTGSGRIGPNEIVWTVSETQPAQNVLAPGGLAGRFKVGVVEVDYVLSGPDGDRLASGKLHRVTWTETYSFLSDLNR